jgi:hypothetical protein
MRLVYIYGPPGVGKLTVARELAALTGFKLFHNHLAANLASSVLPNQSDAYVRLVRQVWRDTFTEAVREAVDLICTAFFHGRPEDAQFVRWMLEPIYAGGGTVVYVQLRCARDEWLRRVPNASRLALNKLVDAQAAAALADQLDVFASVPFEPHLCIVNTSVPAGAVARQIAECFSLPMLGSGAGRPL